MCSLKSSVRKVHWVLFSLTLSDYLKHFAKENWSGKKTLKSMCLVYCSVLRYVRPCYIYETYERAEANSPDLKLSLINSHFILLLNQCLGSKGQKLKSNFNCHTTLSLAPWQLYFTSQLASGGLTLHPVKSVETPDLLPPCPLVQCMWNHYREVPRVSRGKTLPRVSRPWHCEKLCTMWLVLCSTTAGPRVCPSPTLVFPSRGRQNN